MGNVTSCKHCSKPAVFRETIYMYRSDFPEEDERICIHKIINKRYKVEDKGGCLTFDSDEKCLVFRISRYFCTRCYINLEDVNVNIKGWTIKIENRAAWYYK